MGDDTTAAVMQLMPGLFNASGQLDPLAVASALAQLQHQQQGTQPPGSGIGFPPDRSGVKKCGHCQTMKSCVEFSADTSRGDGLRGWCKTCEAEARSSRYKKRKAAAQLAQAARRRYEAPLGAGLGQAGQWQGMGTSAGDTAQMLAALMYAQQQQKNQQQQQQPQHSNRSADTSAAILAALRAAGAAPAAGKPQIPSRDVLAGYMPNGTVTGGLSNGFGSAFTPVGRPGASSFTGTSPLAAVGSSLVGGFGTDQGDRRFSSGGCSTGGDASPQTSDSEQTALAAAANKRRRTQIAAVAQPMRSDGQPPLSLEALPAPASLQPGHLLQQIQPNASNAWPLALAAKPSRPAQPKQSPPAAAGARDLMHLVKSEPEPLVPLEMRVPKRSRTSASALHHLPSLGSHPVPQALPLQQQQQQQQGMPLFGRTGSVVAGSVSEASVPNIIIKTTKDDSATTLEQREAAQWASRMMATLMVMRAMQFRLGTNAPDPRASQSKSA